MNIRDKIFIVTGAGGGIGGDLAISLVENGAKVIAIDLREESLKKLEKKVGSKNLKTYSLDITDQEAVSKMPEIAQKMHGQIDGVINCAGIIQPFVKVNDLGYSAIEKVMNVNFYGTLYITKALLPILLDRPEAYVVNVSSMGGFLPVPGQSVYGASKAAVKLLTEGLYAELLDTNVHVSVVFPGATNTDITKNSGVKTPDTPEDSNVPMLSSKEAAEIIIRGIENNKPQIFTGKDSKFMNILYRFKPVFATKYIAKQMKSLLK